VEIQEDQVYIGEDNSSGSLYMIYPDANFEQQVGEIITRYLEEVER
jgi:hypothetical protein